MNKDELMLKLNPSFQREIFEKLVRKYKGSTKAGVILNMKPSTIRGYKNLYFDSVPARIIDKLKKDKILSSNEIKSNLLLSFSKNSKLKSILSKGREKRTKQLTKWKEEIPEVMSILSDNKLDFKKWFSHYQKLIDFGARKFNYTKIREGYLEVSYITHSNKEKRNFVLKFPKQILLDEEFSYFFGLWCGDRSGGKRFGICNQNEKIIKFTEKFLDKNYQRVEKILYIKKGLPEPNIQYDKKFSFEKDINGWVLSVHSTNGVLYSFFDYLKKDIKEVLSHINKYAFLAGLFDAEGNVSLYNKSFRWACKDELLIKIYSSLLKELNLYAGYDGGCLITYNLSKFYEKIFPFMKHSDKIDKAIFLCTGTGKIPSTHSEILKYLRDNPSKRPKEIAKALKKTKVYSELRLLNNFGFVSHKGYPYKYKLTKKLN
jgi:hypothetical protein